MTNYMLVRPLVTRNTIVNNLAIVFFFFFAFRIFNPKERQKRNIAMCKEYYEGGPTRFYGFKGNLA